MATPNNYTDPTGVAALVIGAVTPVLTLLALVLHWSTDLSNAVVLAATGVLEGLVGLVAVWQARKHAYAPATVERTLEVATRVPPADPLV